MSTQVQLAVQGRQIIAEVHRDREHGWGFAWVVDGLEAPDGVIETGLVDRFLVSPNAAKTLTDILVLRRCQLETLRKIPLAYSVTNSSSRYVLTASKPVVALSFSKSDIHEQTVRVRGEGLPAGRLMPPLRSGQQVEMDLVRWLCRRVRTVTNTR